MASLNKDEIFWAHLHSNNIQLKENNQPTRKMPNLGMLQNSPQGTHPELESILHDRIMEFLIVLKAPTTHKYHWTQRAQQIRFLFNHHDELLHIFETTYTQKSDHQAFETAWDKYVEYVCKTYEDLAEKCYPQGYPACEAEDSCFLCRLQWDNMPNATRQHKKSQCCEMSAEDLLLPDISVFEPNSSKGSQDDKLNQHIWSINESSNQLPGCIEPIN
jgi:hypothetical protein